jgi:hypothetical protein
MPAFQDERVRHFAARAGEAAEGLAGAVAEDDRGPLGIAHRARTLARQAQLCARFAGARELEPTEAQVGMVLAAVRTVLAEEGERSAAALLTDEDVERDVLRALGLEEPRGAGADPYGRPSPQTHPEAWTE